MPHPAGARRIGHGSHAGHQDGKADEDGANTLFLLILAHIEQDADEGENGAEGGGLSIWIQRLSPCRPERLSSSW